MKTLVKRNALAWCSLALAFILITNVPVIYAQQECNVIGGSPGPTAGAIAAGDTAQTTRLFRDGRSVTCLLTARAPFTSGGSYLSDSYMFTNTSGGPICVYVDLDSTGCGVATNQISIAGYITSYNPASILTNIIGDPGLSTGTSFATSMNFPVPTGGTYVVVVHNVNAGTFCPGYTFRQTWSNGCRQPGFDTANDGSADLAVFRPVGGQALWFSQPLPGGTVTQSQLGSAGDIRVPGDYTGDETTDVAVYRPGAQGTWFTSTSPVNNYGAKHWGTTDDVPVQGDYDRDGITDLAVFRPGATNTFFILQSATSTLRQLTLGVSGDRAVPADYDGDGKTDPAVFRPSNGLWTFLNSSGNFAGFTSALHGISTDIPVPADYDGDAKADIAVFRPSEGNWYILRTSLTATGIGSNLVVTFGQSGDLPQPADYDGDKKADQAVYRQLTATWYVNRSASTPAQAQFGFLGDAPASAPNPNTNQ